jgi:hypothetical protein
MNWKGTKGEWKHQSFAKGNVHSDGRTVANCMSHFSSSDPNHIDESLANAELIIDAGNTIQICDRLPSELLAQNEILSGVVTEYEKVSEKVKTLLSERDEALKILKQAINALNRGPRSEEARLLHNEHSQLINKIEHGK